MSLSKLIGGIKRTKNEKGHNYTGNYWVNADDVDEYNFNRGDHWQDCMEKYGTEFALISQVVETPITDCIIVTINAQSYDFDDDEDSGASKIDEVNKTFTQGTETMLPKHFGVDVIGGGLKNSTLDRIDYIDLKQRPYSTDATSGTCLYKYRKNVDNSTNLKIGDLVYQNATIGYARYKIDKDSGEETFLKAYIKNTTTDIKTPYTTLSAMKSALSKGTIDNDYTKYEFKASDGPKIKKILMSGVVNFPIQVYNVEFYKSGAPSNIKDFYGISGNFGNGTSPGGATSKKWLATNQVVKKVTVEGQDYTKISRTFKQAPADLNWNSEIYPTWKW